MQTKIFDAVKRGHKRILVIKARQVAATTGCKFVLHQQWTATPTAALYALVSLRAESATALLDDNRRWMHHPPSILRRELDTRAKGELRLADTEAVMKAFTSRSSTGLRSFSPIAALLSEFAFAPDQEELLAQALSAVGEGLLMIESTANNPGDRFSQLIAGAPENGFHLITHWWWEEPKYCDPAPDGFERTEAEAELGEAYSLTDGQLAWRRRYLKQLGPYKFRREYPACLDDCFLGREGGYYGEEVLQDIHVIEHQLHGKAHGREVEGPHPHDRYVMGVDIDNAAGLHRAEQPGHTRGMGAPVHTGRQQVQQRSHVGREQQPRTRVPARADPLRIPLPVAKPKEPALGHYPAKQAGGLRLPARVVAGRQGHGPSHVDGASQPDHPTGQARTRGAQGRT